MQALYTQSTEHFSHPYSDACLVNAGLHVQQEAFNRQSKTSWNVGGKAVPIESAGDVHALHCCVQVLNRL